MFRAVFIFFNVFCFDVFDILLRVLCRCSQFTTCFVSMFSFYHVFCVNVLILPRVLCQMISFYHVFNHGEVFILRRVFSRWFHSFTHYIYTYRVEVSVDVRSAVSILHSAMRFVLFSFHSAMRFVFSFHSALYMYYYYSTLFIALFSAVEQTHCDHVNFLC